MIRRLWRWIKRLFHKPVVKQVPFHYEEPIITKIGKNRSMIVRTGSSMKRGRLLGVK